MPKVYGTHEGHTINQLKDLLIRSEEQQTGLDLLLGDEYIAVTIIRDLIEHIEAITAEAGREQFEAVYIEKLNAEVGRDYEAADMVALREGDGYGHDRAFLNGMWEGWKAREAVSK